MPEDTGPITPVGESPTETSPVQSPTAPTVANAATLSGEPLYRAAGYKTIEPFEADTSTGFKVPLIRMGKALAGA